MVKRFIGILLAVFVMTGMICTAFAIEDISTYTDEELLWLGDAVDEELRARDKDKAFYLSKGKYVVGEDVPAGAYRALAYSMDPEEEAATYLYLCKSLEDATFYVEGKSAPKQQIPVSAKRDTRIIVTDGMCIDMIVFRGDGVVLIPD